MVTFLHSMGPSSKSLWVANPYRSFFFKKSTVQALSWYAPRDRGGGGGAVKSTRGIEAFYMYINETAIWGGETMNMQKAFQVVWVYLTYYPTV